MSRESESAEVMGELSVLRERLSDMLGWTGAPSAPAVEGVASRRLEGYVEQVVEYPNVEGEAVRAFLLRPEGSGPFPGVVVYHQHNAEWHLGKSEAAGLAGDPLQGFGPMLARRGIVVLAPDAMCFEDRRRTGGGVLPRADDPAQHYDEMAYRLVQGSLLMSLVLADAALAVSVLAAVEVVDERSIGVLGHSMGGHTALFSAPLDERVRFACASGAACGYRARIAAGVGIELAQVIPGILSITDFDGLVSLIAPRPLLLISADEDPYSLDAPAIVDKAARAYTALGARELLQHARHPGGHPLTAPRAEQIIQWVSATAHRRTKSTGARRDEH